MTTPTHDDRQLDSHLRVGPAGELRIEEASAPELAQRFGRRFT